MSCLFFGWGIFAKVVVGILIIGTSPGEDEEKVGVKLGRSTTYFETMLPFLEEYF